MLRTFAIVACVAALGAAGCHMQEPTSPAGGLAYVVPPQPPDLGRYPARLAADVPYMSSTGQFRGVCGGPDPMFAFDKATAKPTSAPTMQVLANCMTQGALRNRSIRLVGRADPRGSEAYNQRLGLARAERVKRYLVNQGVEPARIAVASLGEQDASYERADWRTDRRVDVELLE